MLYSSGFDNFLEKFLKKVAIRFCKNEILPIFAIPNRTNDTGNTPP